MRNTKTKRLDARTNWPFRPTIPKEPSGGSPSTWAAYERDKTDLTALYTELEQAANRSDLQRQFMLEGWRCRQQNLAELQRLADIGREFEALFPGLGAGQIARVVDVLCTRLGSQSLASEPTPEVAAPPVQGRTVRIQAVLKDDPMEGELS